MLKDAKICCANFLEKKRALLLIFTLFASLIVSTSYRNAKVQHEFIDLDLLKHQHIYTIHIIHYKYHFVLKGSFLNINI